MKIGIYNNFAKLGGVNTYTQYLCLAIPSATLVLPESVSSLDNFKLVENEMLFINGENADLLNQFDVLIVVSALGDTTKRAWYDYLVGYNGRIITIVHSKEDIQYPRLNSYCAFHRPNCTDVIYYRSDLDAIRKYVPEFVNLHAHIQCYPFRTNPSPIRRDKAVFIGRLFRESEIELCATVARKLGVEVDYYGELQNVTPDFLHFNGNYKGTYGPERSSEILSSYKYFIFPVIKHPANDGILDWVLLEAVANGCIPVVYHQHAKKYYQKSGLESVWFDNLGNINKQYSGIPNTLEGKQLADSQVLWEPLLGIKLT